MRHREDSKDAAPKARKKSRVHPTPEPPDATTAQKHTPEEPAENVTKGEETLDHPVLDGAEEHPVEHVDPREGMSDPALIRDVRHQKKTVNPYG